MKTKKIMEKYGYVNEVNGPIDKITRGLKVKTTKGKPTKKDAPSWAKYLGRTHEGAFHWLSNDTPVDTPNSNKYFPEANKTKFSGFEDKKSGKGYVEILN